MDIRKEVIKNAIAATYQNGYEKHITRDDDGSYSIHQTKHTIWSDQKVIGKTNICWPNGCMKVSYTDV